MITELLETIKIKEGIAWNLDYHLQRINNAISCYNNPNQLPRHITMEQLKGVIPSELPTEGLHKLKLKYTIMSEGSLDITSVEILPYTPKAIKSLKCVVCNNIKYPHKFQDRSAIDAALSKREDCDDILIIRNDHITDLSFANILFLYGDQWYTPDTPLLKGTCRERLLRNGIIQEARITKKDIFKFDKFMHINAMLNFDPERATELTHESIKIQ